MSKKSVQSELLGLLGRFLLFVALLRLTYPWGLRMFLHLAAPGLVAGDADGENATRVPTEGDKPPGDSWAGPGERLVVVPDASDGSWPMVEGVDGRLYQITPGGRHPVDEGALMKWAAERAGLETELLRRDADGKWEAVKVRTWLR
jgi:hypothetical protein